MQLGDHQLAGHHIFRLKYTELNEIYVVTAMRSFIVSMLAIYIPIYLYNLHYSIREILFFYLVMYIGEAIFEILCTSGISRFGPKHMVALSLPLLIIHFWMLWLLPTYSWPLWFIALEGGLTLALFWQAYNFDFSIAKRKIRASRDIAIGFILVAAMGSIAPAIGGIIATNFGMNYVFAFAIALLFIAIFPLFKTSEPHVPRKIKFSNIKEIKMLGRQIISYGGAAVENSAAIVFWPFFIFLMVKTYQGVGVITSIALIFTVILTYIIGKTTDKKDKCKYIRTGGSLNALIYGGKAIAYSVFHIYILNFLTSITHSFFRTPYVSEYYLHADKESRLEYIAVMEFGTDVVRVFTFSLLVILSFFISDKEVIISGLLLGAVASLLIGLMPPVKYETKLKNKSIKIQSMIRSKGEAG